MLVELIQIKIKPDWGTDGNLIPDKMGVALLRYAVCMEPLMGTGIRFTGLGFPVSFTRSLKESAVGA